MGSIRDEPFSLSPRASSIAVYKFDPEEFRRAITEVTELELNGFLRAYVHEGIPACFSEFPLLWEVSREWIAQHIGVRADHITVVGSARLGFTVKKDEYGRVFGPQSDLDLSVIDPALFDKFYRDVRIFLVTSTQKIKPQASEKEIARWQENRNVLSRTCDRGFGDSNKIPSEHSIFMTAAKLNNAASILTSRLRVSRFMVKYSSFRIYKDWDSFTKSVALNYRSIRRSLV